ncbi:hypothetical protein [Streptomyces sp. NPDC058773]|uniref:AMP-binding enzyme n=1 Tax=Streptomyces sp. NPDC058773 TaxID=3346632 RepID=UPI0036C929BD
MAGRLKDVINRAGEKVPVEEVENHLLAHPALHDVAVIGLPDAQLGERSCACVIALGTPPPRADLTAYLTERGLAAYKLPDDVVVLPAFPRTALGKVDKSSRACRSCAPSPGLRHRRVQCSSSDAPVPPCSA